MDVATGRATIRDTNLVCKKCGVVLQDFTFPAPGGEKEITIHAKFSNPYYEYCSECEELRKKGLEKEQLVQYYLDNLKFSTQERYWKCNFSNFRINQGNRTAYEAVKEWVSEPQNLLFICGNPGTGKTHLAVAAAFELTFTARPTRYVTLVDLVAEIRKASARRLEDKTADSIIDKYACAHRLILDDCGVERSTEFVNEHLYRLLNTRYGKMLPTLITSNLMPENLDSKFGQRLASRILDKGNRVVRINDNDNRIFEPDGETPF